MRIKNLIGLSLTIISMGWMIYAEEPIEKRIFIHFPNNFNSEIQEIGKTKDYEYIKNFALEASPILKKTIKGSISDTKFIRKYHNPDDIGYLSSFILDISVAHYQEESFIGPYYRLGLRFSDVESKSYHNEGILFSTKNDSYTKKEASHKIYMPYFIIGNNFNIFNFITYGIGIGVGYGFISTTGDSESYDVIKGFQLASELNIGALF